MASAPFLCSVGHLIMDKKRPKWCKGVEIILLIDRGTQILTILSFSISVRVLMNQPPHLLKADFH